MNTIWVLKWKNNGDYVTRGVTSTKDISKAKLYLSREEADKDRRGNKRRIRLVKVRGKLGDALLRILAIQAQSETMATTVEVLRQGAERYSEALNKIQLGRHGGLDATQMVLIAWGALFEHAQAIRAELPLAPEEPIASTDTESTPS